MIGNIGFDTPSEGDVSAELLLKSAVDTPSKGDISAEPFMRSADLTETLLESVVNPFWASWFADLAVASA